jgi:hypothetical protein
MSDEHFLTRWSRRKREATEETRAPAKPDAADAARADADDSQPKPGQEPEPAIDLESLPPLESVGAGTDIRAFLQRGVPAELTRAALRRAWTSDPTIRDFIGIAENQWDFAAGDVPGFGPLKALDDVRRMVAEVANEVGKVVEQAPEETAAGAPVSGAKLSDSKLAEGDRPEVSEEPAQDQSEQPSELESAPAGIVHRKEENIAMQKSNQAPEYERAAARRSHGRALPE